MASNSLDPIHFTHTDLDGDWMEVVEGEMGAVIWLRPLDGDLCAVAVHHEDIPKLIETLSEILENAPEGN